LTATATATTSLINAGLGKARGIAQACTATAAAEVSTTKARQALGGAGIAVLLAHIQCLLREFRIASAVTLLAAIAAILDPRWSGAIAVLLWLRRQLRLRASRNTMPR
jgi:hypothetical protein